MGMSRDGGSRFPGIADRGGCGCKRDLVRTPNRRALSCVKTNHPTAPAASSTMRMMKKMPTPVISASYVGGPEAGGLRGGCGRLGRGSRMRPKGAGGRENCPEESSEAKPTPGVRGPSTKTRAAETSRGCDGQDLPEWTMGFREAGRVGTCAWLGWGRLASQLVGGLGRQAWETD